MIYLKLKEKIKEERAKTTQLKERIEMGSSLVEEAKSTIEKINSCYKKLYDTLIKELEESLICPILLEKIKIPAISPSGNIIEKSCLERLVNERRKDPFNNQDI